jgi:flagellar basal-body rod protein FlgB
MIEEAIVGKTSIPLLHKCLNAYSMRHKAIANNIANVEAPGYKRVEVRFEDKLKKALFDPNQALTTTDKNHIGARTRDIESVRPGIEVDAANPGLNGVNNVDIDHEMADLAKNSLDFSTAATLLRHEFSRFRMVMGGGAGGQ